MKYNIFGSKDSLDYDVMFAVDAIPESKQESKQLCLDLEDYFPKTDKKINVNICVVEGERITKVYKGTPDECNNSIFYTYELHDQTHDRFANGTVERNVALKVDRSLRILLSFLSRTEYRSIVKSALGSPDNAKRENCINCLRAIDFNLIKSFGSKNGEPLDIIKQIAFQIGQTTALVKSGVELYTKQEVDFHFPPLKPYLKRQECSLDSLDRHKSYYLYEISMWRSFVTDNPNDWTDHA